MAAEGRAAMRRRNGEVEGRRREWEGKEGRKKKGGTGRWREGGEESGKKS